MRGSWTHGLTSKGNIPSGYYSWLMMKDRCNNPNNPSYHNYGGRGVVVCSRWNESFELFIEDVGVRPTKAHTLDRHPNKNGNYEPGNVRWATRKEQMSNVRYNVWVEYNGEKMVLAEFKRRIGEEDNTNVNLLLKKMSPEEVAQHYSHKRK